MVFELVKNSLRAVQERFMDSDKIAPPIRIIVADGLEDVTIKACLSICSLSSHFLAFLEHLVDVYSEVFYSSLITLKKCVHCII